MAEPLRRTDRQSREDQRIERPAAEHVADGHDRALVADFAHDVSAESPEPFESALQTSPCHGGSICRRPSQGTMGPRRWHEEEEVTRASVDAGPDLLCQLLLLQRLVCHHEVVAHPTSLFPMPPSPVARTW